MIGRRLTLIALLAVIAPLSAEAHEFGSPPPNLLFQLQRQNRSRPWLHVMLDSSRVTLRSARLDEAGLGGIEVPATQAPLMDPIPWRSIARIDGIETGAKTWGIIGAVVGGGLGWALGSAIGENERTAYTDPVYGASTAGHGGIGSFVGFMALGGLGAWQGSRFGSHKTHDREWYVASQVMTPAVVSTPTILAETTPASAPDSAAATVVPPTRTATAAPSQAAGDALALRLAESPGVKSAVAKIYPRDLIRMRGDFGQFQGRATVIGPRGMEGLIPDRHADRYLQGTVPAGLIGWHRIDHVEKRGNGAGRGALIGAVGLGLLGALGGVAFDSAFGGDEPLQAALYGGGLMGGIGLLLGAATGAAFPAWHVVYDGP